MKCYMELHYNSCISSEEGGTVSEFTKGRQGEGREIGVMEKVVWKVLHCVLGMDGNMRVEREKHFFFAKIGAYMSKVEC